MSPLTPNQGDIPAPGDITYFAESDYRNRNKKFGIKREDRTRHTYVIGKTGMGKTTLLENMAVQDIQNGNGMAVIDPHGDMADKLLDHVPEDRIDDVMYFAPFDLEHPISFNVMEDVGDDKRHLVADGLLSAFKKIWVDMWSGRMEYLLNNALLALLEYPDSTILGVNRMFADKAYRKRVVANVSDVSVRAFWEEEYANYDENFARQAASAIQNKVGQFVSNPQVRNIVGQVNSSFDVREMMDGKKIMLINLSKGQVGEDNARLIGSMLITKMYLAAMSRADTGAEAGDISNLPQFYFYVDEFQSFANESFAGILSEARKYKLNLTIAHQYIEQMTEDVRNAVFGNVGTMIAFRVGAFDAEVLEREFAPEFEAEDLVNLGFAQVYLKLMIDGVSSKPFSARTLPPIEPNDESFREEIIAQSREAYGRPREEVETEIDKWHDSTYGIIDDDKAYEMAEKQRKQREENSAGDADSPKDGGTSETPTKDKHELVDGYELGEVVEGTVTGIVEFGIFVKIEEGLEGLVHISELDEEHVEDPGDLFEGGQEVAAKVIKKDGDQISLSIKQLKEESEGEEEEAKQDQADEEPEKEERESPEKSDGDEAESSSESEERPEKSTASLSDLESEKKQGAADDKGPSEANKSKLQSALSKVKTDQTSNLDEQEDDKDPVEEEKQAKQTASQPTDEEPRDEQAAEQEDDESETEESSAPDEIPEEDLRKMLSVDEDEDS